MLTSHFGIHKVILEEYGRKKGFKNSEKLGEIDRYNLNARREDQLQKFCTGIVKTGLRGFRLILRMEN